MFLFFIADIFTFCKDLYKEMMRIIYKVVQYVHMSSTGICLLIRSTVVSFVVVLEHSFSFIIYMYLLLLHFIIL